MPKLLREWAPALALGVALGLGVAWLELALGIPKFVVQWFWIVLMVLALGFAAWVAWGYYSAIRDEDDWD